VLCYRNRTLAACGRLSSLVPRLDLPLGIGLIRPSDTRQPHAEGRDDLFALLAAVITKTHTGGAVHALPFCSV